MTEHAPEETPGQLALFDRDLNPTPEAQGFDPEGVADQEKPALCCIYCSERLYEQPSGRLTGLHREITCHKSPHRTHEIDTPQETPC